MAKTKGTKNYPQGVKEKIIKEYNSGLSQCELSRKKVLFCAVRTNWGSSVFVGSFFAPSRRKQCRIVKMRRKRRLISLAGLLYEIAI